MHAHACTNSCNGGTDRTGMYEGGELCACMCTLCVFECARQLFILQVHKQEERVYCPHVQYTSTCLVCALWNMDMLLSVFGDMAHEWEDDLPCIGQGGDALECVWHPGS